MAEGGKKVSVLVELKIQVGPSIYVICLKVLSPEAGIVFALSVPLDP